MSALSVRLDKLAARMPPPPAPVQVAAGSLKASLDRIMAQTAFLKTATPLQRYKFYADDIARLERRLLEDDPREGLAATLAKARTRARANGGRSHITHGDARRGEHDRNLRLERRVAGDRTRGRAFTLLRSGRPKEGAEQR